MGKRVRLEGPLPERLVEVKGPVVSEGRGSLGELVLSLVLLGFVVYSVPYEVRVILEEEAGGWDLTLSILMLGLMSLLLFASILLLKTGVAKAWRTRVVLDVDGVRAMREDRVLEEIAFDGRTKVEVLRVSNFTFERRFRSVSFDAGEEAWPVVEAAAWKHRMMLKENIAKELVKGDG